MPGILELLATALKSSWSIRSLEAVVCDPARIAWTHKTESVQEEGVPIALRL